MSCCDASSSRKKAHSPILPFLAVLFLVAVLLGTCRSKETPQTGEGTASIAEQTSTLKKAAEELAARQPSLTRVNAEWNFGETVSAVSGYYDGDRLRMIDEQMDMGGRGHAASRFFYTPEGKLFAYEEKKETKGGSPADPAGMEESELRLYFADSGQMLSSERTLAGKSAPLLGIEEQTVRMHARELEATLAEALARKH